VRNRGVDVTFFLNAALLTKIVSKRLHRPLSVVRKPSRSCPAS
jgi:hypothetical protein